MTQPKALPVFSGSIVGCAVSEGRNGVDVGNGGERLSEDGDGVERMIANSGVLSAGCGEDDGMSGCVGGGVGVAVGIAVGCTDSAEMPGQTGALSYR